MTRDETKKIVTMIATSYSKHLLPEINEYYINLWTAMLGDMDYQEVSLLVQKWIMTEKYPPGIADIRREITALKTERKEASEAWQELMAAIKSYGSYREEEALESLSEATRRVVERFGYKFYCQMPEAERTTYFAQFRNAYDVMADREHTQAQLPEALQQKLKMLANHASEVKAIEG